MHSFAQDINFECRFMDSILGWHIIAKMERDIEINQSRIYVKDFFVIAQVAKRPTI